MAELLKSEIQGYEEFTKYFNDDDIKDPNRIDQGGTGSVYKIKSRIDANEYAVKVM